MGNPPLLSLPYLGERCQVEIHPAAGAEAAVVREGSTLSVQLPEGANYRDLLIQWYRRQAKAHLSQRVRELAAAHDFTPGTVSIRGLNRQWGSSSSNGHLTFHWRLMMTPPGAIDYIVIHELCHLDELSHSPAFWTQVRQYCPDYPYWERWLSEHGAYLLSLL